MLLALIVAASASAGGRGASKRERAEKAYSRALAAQAKLEARRPQSRSMKDYLKLVGAFDLVYRTDPGYPKTPYALSAEASVYQEMGHVSGSGRFYERAVETYQFLAEQYPGATISQQALFKVAEIYRVDLVNPEQAAKAYGRLLRLYPSAPDAAEAELRLAEVNPSPTAAQDAEVERQPAAPGFPAGPSATLPARLLAVNDVRYWEGPNYTRIVISVDDPATYQAVRLKNPDRLVFDLSNTRLSHALAGKTFPLKNGFLREIRVAQFRPDVTRVVLDLARIHDYSVFTLPNPFRLIIDVHGAAQPLLASSGVRPLVERESPIPSPVTVASAAAPRVPAPETQPGRTEENASSNVAATLGDAFNSGVAAGGTAESSGGGSGVPDDPYTAAAVAPRIRAPSPTATGSTTLTRALGLKIGRIVIDPGHGGHDTGTLGPDGVEEKNVALDVALRLRKLVQQRMGAEVVMTRSDDTFIPLEERTAIANQRAADLFVSIHCNASRDPSARGIEVYYLNFTSDPNSLEVAARENATSQESVHQLQSLIKKIALTEKIDESDELARQVDVSLEQATARSGNHQPNRGLKKAPFVVLIGANMPSILAEISFLTNPRDENLLAKASYRQQIAEGLYQGIARYVANLGSMKIAERAAGRAPLHRVASRETAADRGGAVAGGDPPKF